MLLDLYDLALDSLPVPVYLVNFETPTPSYDDLTTVRLNISLQTYLFASLVIFRIDYGDRFDAVDDVLVLLLLDN